MLNFIAVGLGGLIGAISRYSIMLIPISTSYWPIKTLLINFVGSLVIGCTGQAVAMQPDISPYWVLFIQVGICGGFTTFSTFSLETYNLINDNQFGTAAVYIIASVTLCVIAVFLGIYLVKTMFAN